MTKKIIVADSDQAKFLRMNNDLIKKFLSGVYSPEEFFSVFDEFIKNPLDKSSAEKKKSKNQYLRLISGDEKIIIAATSGRRMIKKAGKVFTGYLDPDFTNWNASGISKKTPEASVKVYEMIKKAPFKQMFTSLSSDIDKLLLTEHQIIEFCERHKDWLRMDGYGTFFIYKNEGNFFVAYVFVYDDGRLLVYVNVLEYDYVWNADYRYRVVVPQL